MKLRILVLFSCMLAVWSFLVLRAAQIQIFPDSRLAGLKERQFEAALSIQSRRGAIVDRNGRELAASVPAYSLFVDPKEIKNPRETSKKLGRWLRMSEKNIYRKLTRKNNRFTWIARQLDDDIVLKIRALKNPGLGFIEEPKRIYPNGTLLGQVLGFVGRDGRGLEGLERGLNKKLSGEVRKVVVARDARGRPLLTSASVISEIPDGSQVELTIDSDIQFELEKRLSEAVQDHEATSAIGVVLDAQTSDVLAMGMTPSVDLNQPFRVKSHQRRNRAVSDAFEPGSTLKTFVIAAALKEGKALPSSKYYCEKGKFKIGKRVIGEASNHKFEWLTVTEILAHSSNIGTAKMAFQLGADKLYDNLKDFGFGQKTGVSFPGEYQGILQSKPWHQHLLANISFGHGITVTPLQLASAYASIANGGVLRTPRLIKKITPAKDPEATQEIDIDKGRRVLDKDTASHLRMMLTVATGVQGTGAKARIPGFLVAGKTGTAQMVDFEKGGYKKDAYISSFAGFAPSHDPRYVIYIAVEDPKKGYYGSEVAAPVFAKMAQYALRKLALPPVILNQANVVGPEIPERMVEEQDKAIQRAIQGGTNAFPDLKGLALREALKRIGATQTDVRIQGTGFVSRTTPQPGDEWKKDQPITIILNESL